MDEERETAVPEKEEDVTPAPAPEAEAMTPEKTDPEPEARKTETVSPEPIHLTIRQRLAGTSLVFRLIVLAVLIAALVILGIVIKNKLEKNRSDGRITIDEIEFRIKEVLHTARLNTAEYMYKGVLNWYVEEESGKQTKVGFVKYSGRIKYGVEFDEIDVSLDEKKNVIVITIPPLVREPFVEEPECIFLNQNMRMKYNDSKYLNLMRQACMDHIIFNAEKDDAMEAAAEKYTKELVESLTSPFFEADSGVSYEIRLED